MPNLLNILRYFVFVVFLVCNAVITSVAVWNLSIIEAFSSQSKTKQTDSLLIFVGASGLLLIFTVLFFELYGKSVFIGRVWFELVWVAFYCILELAGAASYTALSSSQTCGTNANSLGDTSELTPLSSDACASTQVLQAFTWICATLLLGYFTFLAILTYVKRKDDPTIWRCSVRRFPVMNNSNPNLKGFPESSSNAFPRFRASAEEVRVPPEPTPASGHVPVIAAPQPRRAPRTREPVLSYNSGLSYRSGLGLEYEIEHYQSPESVLHATSTEGHGTAVTATSHTQGLSPAFQFPNDRDRVGQSSLQPLRPILRPSEPVEPVRQQPIVVSTPFYPTSVVSAVKDPRTTIQNQPQAPAPAAVRAGGGRGEIRRLPPSPPPLGDWPRLDATSRPTRVRRKPLPRPEPEPEPEPQPASDRYEVEPQPRPDPQPLPEPQGQAPQHSNSISYSHSQSQHSHSISHSQSRHERRVLPVPTRTISQSRPQPQPPTQPLRLESEPQSQSQPPQQPQPQLQSQPQPQPQVQRHMRPLPPTQPTMPSSSSYPVDANALSAALYPLQASQSMRSKPTRPYGPRRKSNSIDDGQPTDVELSRTSRTLDSSGYS